MELISKSMLMHYFEEFYRECISSKKEIVYSVVENKIFDSFVVWVRQRYGESAGEIWLKQYVEYQFSYWKWLCAKQELKFSNIRPAWVFGETARERYLGFKQKIGWHIPDVRIAKSLNIKPFAPNKDAFVGEMNPKPFEERERERFHNTEAGLSWCFENTSMYHPSSKFCNTCEHKESCIKVQQKTFSKIYKKRTCQNN